MQKSGPAGSPADGRMASTNPASRVFIEFGMVPMRIITHEGIQWSVDELDTSATPGSRGPRCLVFDGDSVVRRVWKYPTDWRTLSDTALGMLLDDQSAPETRSSLGLGDPELDPLETARECGERTRALLAELSVLRDANRALREDRDAHLAECRRQRAAMRAAIETYASALRASGVPPERALVMLKSAMHHGIADLEEPEDHEREEIVRDGVAWAIRAYYAA